jgi:hypothetical protein
MRLALLALMMTTPAAVQQPAYAPFQGIQITISSPTYYPDGEVRGAKFGELLAQGKSVDFYVAAGHTLCESMSASPQPPGDAGYGWKVTLTVSAVGNDGAAKIHSTWHTAWDRGRAVDGPVHTGDLLLQAGGTALLDFVRRGDSADDIQCSALGMGLQVAMPPRDPDSTPLIEAELWLVRHTANGSEDTQHQVVRFRGDSPGEYFFDETTLPGTSLRARVSGTLRSLAVADDKIGVELMVRESLVGPQIGSGSSTRRLALQPGEVNAIDLRRPGSTATANPDSFMDSRLRYQQDLYSADTLSLRLRVKRVW